MKATAKNLLKLQDGKHSVAPNLYLFVKGRARSFVFRYMLNGKRREKGIGSANEITISEAKEIAEEFRTKLREGFLPTTPKENLIDKLNAVNDPIFENYALTTIETISKVRVWRNKHHKEQWFSSIKNYAIPVIGKKKLSEITRRDVLDVLGPIWEEKNETASRIRGRLENIFSYAVSDGLMDSNPALWRGNLDRDLPPPGRVQTKGHYEAMPLNVLQEKIGCLYPATSKTGQAVLFTILTASRIGESAPAKWEEIDWEAKIWSIPPERRKDGKPYPHRVPLSDQAIMLLKSVERKGDAIFGFNKNSQDNSYSLRSFLKRKTGTNATMHGFRSTFRDWAAENGISDIVAEKCLMHATGSAVVQAYQRSDLLDQRREVMQKWADAVFAKINAQA